MPRSISGLVMQLMRVANVGGGGGLRAEVTSEMSLRSSRNMLFPFKAKWRLLAWMQASWRARICWLRCLLIGGDVPSLVERNVVARSLSWATWWARRCMVTDRWRSEGSSRLVTSATAERLWYST